MVNNNRLDAQINVTTGNSAANVRGIENSIRRLQTQLKNSNTTVAQAAQINSRIASEYARIEKIKADAVTRGAKRQQDAALATAKVEGQVAKNHLAIRLAEIRTEEASARATEAAESRKQRALRATQKAANTDFSPGATTAIPKNYLASKAVGLPTQNLNLPDAGALNQTRYALYDVATTVGVLGGALTAAGSSAVVFATKYETAIAQLSRTTQLDKNSTQLNQLNSDLMELSETIPVGFTNLAEIASLGAQLNIASNDLEAFSEVVAQFATVSQLSTERVAQDFGAIGELLDVSAGEYKNLGSAINYAGITSVATDAEILSLTTSIAASANQAGFAADETVGLAAALASLRIAPEQARGVILRLFADFDRVTSEGGEKLDKYANVLGVTTTAAKELWDSNPQQFFDQLLQGLSTAEDLNATLTNLGITETRESNVLQRLAGNYDVYAQSIRNATGAYESGTFLGESFSKQADTIAARIQILVNSIENLLANAGESLLPIIKPLLEVITAIVQGVSQIPAPILGVLTAATLLAGAFALIVAGGAALIASAFAVQTALVGLEKNALGATTIGAALKQTIQQLTTALGVNSIAAKVNATTLGTLLGVSEATMLGFRGMTGAVVGSSGAFGVATAGARGFGIALLGIPIVNIVAALSIAIPVVLALVGAFNEANAEVDRLQEAFVSAGGGIESLRSALEKDQQAILDGAETFGTMRISLKGLSEEEQNAAEVATDHADAVDAATGVMEENDTAITDLSSGMEDLTYKLGANTVAWFQNAAAQGEALKNITGAQAQGLENIGFNFEEATKRGLEKNGGAAAYVQELYDAQLAKIRETGPGGIASQGLVIELDKSRQLAVDLANEIDGGRIKLQGAQAQARVLGISAGIITDEFTAGGAAVSGMEDAIRSAFSGLNVQAGFLDSIEALNTAIAETGPNFNSLSAEGRANLGLLEDAFAEAAAYGGTLGMSAEESMANALSAIDLDSKQVIVLMQQLAAADPTLYASLNIDDVLAKYNQMQSLGLVGAAGIQALESNLNSLKSKRADLLKQQKTSGGGGGGGGGISKKAQSSVKTLEEYVRDLATAMKEAFDKRYGLPQAIDDVSAKFNTMKDNLAAAKKEVRDLRTELSTLAADRVVLEAQLIVAEDYGDTTRAGVIRAELDKNKNDTADTEGQLADAIARSTLELTGNTSAAIDNRAAIISLLGAYQSQIEAYAATGKSAAQVTAYAKTLKAEFQSQLIQMGYNANAVNNYAKTFDTLSAAVRGVPTNKEVKITANTSGASGKVSDLSAQLAALEAQIDRVNGDLKKAKTAAAKEVRRQALLTEARLIAQSSTTTPGSAGEKRLEEIQKILASGNYARGGVIGGQGRAASKYQDDTLINAKIGEGVVTLDGMKYLGSDGLNAINQQQNPFPSQYVVQQGDSMRNSAQVLVVELSAYDRAVQEAILNRVGVKISGSALQGTVNAEDTNAARRRTR